MCRDFANSNSHLRLSRALNRTLSFRLDRVRLPHQAPLNMYELTPVKARRNLRLKKPQIATEPPPSSRRPPSVTLFNFSVPRRATRRLLHEAGPEVNIRGVRRTNSKCWNKETGTSP